MRGLEGEVPGAWVDGAVHEPFEVLEFGVEERLERYKKEQTERLRELSSMGIGFLAPVLVWPAWQLTLLRYKVPRVRGLGSDAVVVELIHSASHGRPFRLPHQVTVIIISTIISCQIPGRLTDPIWGGPRAASAHQYASKRTGHQEAGDNAFHLVSLAALKASRS